MTATWSGNPATWASGALTAAAMNTEIRDRMDWLKEESALLAQPVGVQAYRASQTLAAGADTFLSFTGTDDFDSHAFHDPSTNAERLTVPAGMGGYYHITVRFLFDLAAGGTMRIVVGLNNPAAIGYGSALKGMGGIIPGGGNDTYATVSGYALLAVGDYVTCSARESASTAVTEMYFAAMRIAAS